MSKRIDSANDALQKQKYFLESMSYVRKNGAHKFERNKTNYL